MSRKDVDVKARGSLRGARFNSDHPALSHRRGTSPPSMRRDRPRRASPLPLHRERLREASPPPRHTGRNRGDSPLQRNRLRGDSPLFRRERMRADSPLMHRDGTRGERIRGNSPPMHRDATRGDRRREDSPLMQRNGIRGGSGGHQPRQSPPRKYHSRSPRRGPDRPVDDSYAMIRSRSALNSNRHSSLEPHPRDRQAGLHVRETPPRPLAHVPGIAPHQAAAGNFPGDHSNRQLTEALLSRHRNEIIGRQVGPPLFPPEIGVEGGLNVQDGQVNETSLNSMLVPRSIILEDGSVGTFYSLPPDPLLSSLPPKTDDVLGARAYPAYADTVPRYIVDSADPRYAVETLRTREPSRDVLIPDRRGVDERVLGQNAFITGNGGLSVWPERRELELLPNRRERPSSPRQNGIDAGTKMRLRSPLRDDIRRLDRDGRDIHVSEGGRSMRITAVDRRGPFLDPGNRAVDRFGSSPGRSIPGESQRRNAAKLGEAGHTGNLREDGLIRYPEEMLPRIICAEDIPDKYTRESRSLHPNDRHENRLYDHIKAGVLRQIRRPSREAADMPHIGDLPLRRGPIFRTDGHPSPRNAGRVSPRRGRSLTPPALRREMQMELRELERRGWKRKYSDLAEDFVGKGHPLEPEFKRRGREEGFTPEKDLHGRRGSGWGRQLDGFVERRFERLQEEVSHGNHYEDRPMRERCGSPRHLRGFSPYSEENRMRVISNRNEFARLGSKHQRGENQGTTFTDRNRLLRKNGAYQGNLRDEHEIVPDLPEDSSEFKQQVLRAFMKYAKVLNENPRERKKYEEQGKDGVLMCLACGRSSKQFVDTNSLVVHSFMSQKRGLRAEHLGLCKAVCTVMGWSHEIEPTTGKAYQQIASEEARVNKEDLILWPPAVLVHNAHAGGAMEGQQQEGAAEAVVRELLKDSGLSHERIKIVVGKQDTVIIKYLATLTCLREAERAHQYFTSIGHGRDDWEEIEKQSAMESSDPTKKEDVKKSKNVGLYGYLARAHDLDRVDLEFRRRCQVRSRKEIEAIADDSLLSKKPES